MGEDEGGADLGGQQWTARLELQGALVCGDGLVGLVEDETTIDIIGGSFIGPRRTTRAHLVQHQVGVAQVRQRRRVLLAVLGDLLVAPARSTRLEIKVKSSRDPRSVIRT